MNYLIRSKTIIVWKKIKIKLDDFRNNGKKKKFGEHFWELLDELLKKIWFVYGLYKYQFTKLFA